MRICRSASLDEVVNTSGKAAKAVEDLNTIVNSRIDTYKNHYKVHRDRAFLKAKVPPNEPELINEYEYLSVEFADEFNLEAISKVISGALEVLLVGNRLSINPLNVDKTVKSFTSLVSALTSAAKMSSKSSSSFSFNMNKLSEDGYAFIYARTTMIEDKATFGKSKVSATSIISEVYKYVDGLEENEDDFLAKAQIDALTSFIDIKTSFNSDSLELGKTRGDADMFEVQINGAFNEGVENLKTLNKDSLANHMMNSMMKITGLINDGLE